jgi:hypothetical protein
LKIHSATFENLSTMFVNRSTLFENLSTMLVKRSTSFEITLQARHTTHHS